MGSDRDDALAPDPEALIEEARERQRRRRLRGALAAAAIFAAAAVAGGGYVLSAGGGGAPTAQGLERGLAASLARSSGLIESRDMQELPNRSNPFPPGVHETHQTLVLTDLATGSHRTVWRWSIRTIAGYHASYEFVDGYTRAAGPRFITWRGISVDYGSRTAQISSGRLPASTPLTPAADCACNPWTDDENGAPRSTPPSHVVVLANETVAGQPAFHLRFTVSDGSVDGIPRLETLDVWLDRSTYLPIQELQIGSGSGATTTETEFRWLPRTAANLAMLHVTIPPGFAHTSASPLTLSPIH